MRCHKCNKDVEIIHIFRSYELCNACYNEISKVVRNWIMDKYVAKKFKF